MKKVYDFLKAAGTYYLATLDADQPRVCPFGTVNIFEDKLYIQPGKGKAVYYRQERQLGRLLFQGCHRRDLRLFARAGNYQVLT